jgi:hypothetical protein
MAERKLGRKTSPGFGDPHESVRLRPPQRGASLRPGPDVHAQAGRSLPPPRLDAPPAPRADSGRPTRVPRLLEVEITQERGRTPRPDPLRRSFEVWTQNTVYVLDSRMRCVEVLSPGSTEPKSDHPFLGSRLVGGQVQHEGSIEMSYPFPRPGAFAVFEMRKGTRRQFSRTSAVERVVVRERIVTLIGPTEPTWPDIVRDQPDDD